MKSKEEKNKQAEEVKEQKAASEEETLKAEAAEEKTEESAEEAQAETKEEAEAESGTEAKEDKMEEVKEPAKEEKKEDEDLQTRYLRLAADFQNYKRRVEKEKSDIYSYGNEKFAVDLLDVIDNFERALAAAPKDDKFAEGIELILKQLTAVLNKNGVTEIEALGKPFDPNFHNAVMTEAAEEGTESGTITKVLQKGYLLNNKVIRPSMVAVAQ